MTIFSRPSPGLVVAVVALAAALVGTAVAGPVQISLSKREKKQVRKIAKKIAAKQANARITRRAPRLRVGQAARADSATTAGTATSAGTAGSAGTAASAGNAAALGGVGPGGYAKTQLEPVRRIGASGQPPFENNYSNLGGGNETAGFYKDGFGIVHLVGDVVVPVGLPSVIFTLPTDYRPSAEFRFPTTGTASVESTSVVTVKPSGTVSVLNQADVGTPVTLNGIYFRR